MAFNFRSILDIVKVVSKTRTFDTAATLAFKRVGQRIEEHADNPAAIKEIARELISGAPELVGAVVKGTEAHALVPAENIHKG
jgi:hypothetical protein